MTAVSGVETVVVNVSPKTNWVFVAVTTDDGDTGWGECSLNGWEPLLVACAAMRAPRAVGCDIDDSGRLARFTRCIPHSPGGTVGRAVLSAIEQACTDLRARRAGEPISALLGGLARASIPAYANVNRGISERSPAGFAAAATRAVAAGYRAVKVAPFDGVVAEDASSTPIEERIRVGVDRVFAVRDAIGTEVALLVDCHWRFDEARAVALVRNLAPAALHWLECPVSEHPSRFASIARLRRVAHDHGMRLAGGEGISGPDDAKAMCDAGLYDVLMPDIKYVGGCRGMLAIADICAAHGVAFSPHNPSGPIAHLASIQVCATVRSLQWLEHQWGESALFYDLIGGDVAPLVGGAFDVPTSPGLGAALDRAVALRHPYVRLADDANLDERLG
ncbi:MAG TPA: mandelate racemase/muconate lactonizing enzyme family protein [Casimicrobiaceae bacterium]|nr:mandelate racemase/muconate lactonizing enzyme family protein [Casimicrobiaceae bacterium]